MAEKKGGGVVLAFTGYWVLPGDGRVRLADGAWMVRGDFCVAEFTWRRGEWPCAELSKAVWASSVWASPPQRSTAHISPASAQRRIYSQTSAFDSLIWLPERLCMEG